MKVFQGNCHTFIVCLNQDSKEPEKPGKVVVLEKLRKSFEKL